MKYLIINLSILFILAASAPCAYGQSRDKQASQILEQVTEKAKSHNSISIDFNYQMENPDANINEITTGTALMSGDSYRLEIAGQTIISNGETIWTVITDAEEVQINDATDNGDAFTPTNLLTSYTEDYKSKLMPEITRLNGKNVYALELTPNDKKSFERVKIYVDKDKMELYQMEIFDQNQSKYTYNITRYETDVELDENAFVFTVEEFPGFYVIDMR
jgi:outer membrane lipoprotein carrier protein